MSKKEESRQDKYTLGDFQINEKHPFGKLTIDALEQEIEYKKWYEELTRLLHRQSEMLNELSMADQARLSNDGIYYFNKIQNIHKQIKLLILEG